MDGAWCRKGKIGNRAVSQSLAINHPLVWVHSKQEKCQTNVNISLLFMDMQHIFHLIKILWIKISCCHHSLTPNGAFYDLVFVTFFFLYVEYWLFPYPYRFFNLVRIHRMRINDRLWYDTIWYDMIWHCITEIQVISKLYTLY